MLLTINNFIVNNFTLSQLILFFASIKSEKHMKVICLHAHICLPILCNVHINDYFLSSSSMTYAFTS